MEDALATRSGPRSVVALRHAEMATELLRSLTAHTHSDSCICADSHATGGSAL